MATKAKKQTLPIKRMAGAKPSLIVFGLIGMILSYSFVSRAFDTGSYWQYLGSIVLAVLSIRLFLRSLKK